jgi:hypothetical protein
MTQRLARSWRRRLLLGLCVLLAVEFVLGGAAKFDRATRSSGPRTP